MGVLLVHNRHAGRVAFDTASDCIMFLLRYMAGSGGILKHGASFEGCLLGRTEEHSIELDEVMRSMRHVDKRRVARLGSLYVITALLYPIPR